MNNLKINFKAIALVGATILTLTTLSGTVSFEKDPYLYVPSIFETYDFSAKENDEKRRKLNLGFKKSEKNESKSFQNTDRIKIC